MYLKVCMCKNLKGDPNPCCNLTLKINTKISLRYFPTDR